MVGAVPAYIARQMGNKSAVMLFRTYSKWIDGDRSERERVQKLLEAHASAVKLEAVVIPADIPECP